MKKIVVLFVAVAFIFGMSACGTTSSAETSSSPRKIAGRVPAFVQDALKNVPEDALVGVGTAKLASLSQSRTLAQTRARADISRQLNTMISDMVRDYTASSEVDPASAISFQENFTVALSKSTLQGASAVGEDLDDDGNYWSVVYLSKNSAASEINQAVNASKLAVPALASFDAEARMNATFEKMAASEVQIADK